jgi:hypothetical protein
MLSRASTLLHRLELLSQFIYFVAGYSGPQKDKLLRRRVLNASKSIYVGGTLISILISLYLYLSGKRESGIFVGLWAPTVMQLGRTLLEEEE